jgi:REP element-mobilizing transposase RayT
MLRQVAPLDTAEREIVKRDVLFWHRKKWLVHALVVMPTHVHILATPLEADRGEWYSLSEILHSVKLGSARRVNQFRGTRGPVWCPESYDHIIRNEQEWSGAFDYVLNNSTQGGFEGDPYTYDGFWCESMEGIGHGCSTPICSAGSQTCGHAQVSPLRHVAPRVAQDSFVQRHRNLPHWERPGASYHLQFALKGHRVPNTTPPL